MLNVIVLVAMAVTAAAFGAGLTMQAGLPLLPVLIGATALFLVMATTFLRGGRGGGAVSSDRLDDLEQALEVIDIDLQRLDGRAWAGSAAIRHLHDDAHARGGRRPAVHLAPHVDLRLRRLAGDGG